MKKLLLVIVLVFLTFSHAIYAAEKPLGVVASFSLLGDMAKEIGGDPVNVITLVGPDTDAHTYQPTPQDIKAVAAADIIIINGLGFEGWLNRIIGASGTKAKLLVASAGVKPRFLDADSEHPVADPHAWQNLAFGQIYARNIAGGLMAAHPAKAGEIRQRAKAYIAKIAETDKWVRQQLSNIPETKRKVITNHESFGYFGDAYGITFLAPVGGMNEGAEPSAAVVGRLIDQIKTEGIRRVFIENMSNPRLIEQIAKESGASLGGTLYSDSLSPPDGPAPTYLALFRNNVPKLRESMAENR